MSKNDHKNKYLNLEGMRLSYNPKLDVLNITSSDEALSKKGFKLTISKDTHADYILRDLMKEEGLLFDDAQKLIPQESIHVMGKSEDPHTFSLGLGFGAKPITWDTRVEPHLAISGAVGSGKSMTVNTLISSCIANNDTWEVYMYSPNEADAQSYAKYVNTVKRVTSTEEELLDMLIHLKKTMDHVNQDKKKKLVIIDEIGTLRPASDSEADNTYSELNRTLLETFYRVGRSAGIHIVSTSQSFSHSGFEHLLRHAEKRILFSPNNIGDAHLLFNGAHIMQKQSRQKGRAWTIVNSRVEPFIMNYSTNKLIDEWIVNSSEGQLTEPELYRKLKLSIW